MSDTPGRRGRMRLRLAAGWSASSIDLREQAGEALGAEPALTFTPWQLVSVRIARLTV